MRQGQDFQTNAVRTNAYRPTLMLEKISSADWEFISPGKNLKFVSQAFGTPNLNFRIYIEI